MSSQSSRSRIGFCITELDPGGAERSLVQLVTRLDRQTWEPAVFCLSSRGPLADDLERAGIEVQCLGARRAGDLWVLSRLTKALRQFQPSLLQTYLFHANIAGRLAGRLASVPHVVSGIRVAERRGRAYLWLDRWTEGLVARHVCVSRDVARFAAEVGGLSPAKLLVIPNGVDADRFRNASPADLCPLGIPAEARVLVCVGRLDPQKAPLFLLESLAEILYTHQCFQLLFVGDGPLKVPLQEKILALELGSQVHLAGWRGDIPEILAAADGLVLGSRWEGMPNVVLEAMAAGLPVITSQVEGVSDLVQPGQTGWSFPLGDASGLKACVREWWNLPELAAACGNNAQALVVESFTWERTVAAYAELYRELLRI